MSARLLVALAIPGHVLFATVIYFIAQDKNVTFGPIFIAIYLAVCLAQVNIL